MAVTAIALMSIYAVAMVSMFLFKDRSFKGQEEAGGKGQTVGQTGSGLGAGSRPEAQDAPSPLEVMQACCDAIAERERLTPREREILVHLGLGHTVSAIAKELVVSENTVKFHVKGIYQKLDVHSRAEIMALIDSERVS